MGASSISASTLDQFWRDCFFCDVVEGETAGGVCEQNREIEGKRKSLNTGIVTLQNAGYPVSSKVSEITFAHELGHNFGAEVWKMKLIV